MKETTTNLERLNFIPGWERLISFGSPGSTWDNFVTMNDNSSNVKIKLFEFTFEELEEKILSNIDESIFKNKKIQKCAANIVTAMITDAVKHDYIHALMGLDDYARIPDSVHYFRVDFKWACYHLRHRQESTLTEKVCSKELLKRMAKSPTFDEMLESCDFNNSIEDKPDHFDRSFLDILRRKHV